MSAAVITTPEAPRRPSVARMLMRDTGGAISFVLVLLILGAALFAPWLSPRDPFETDLMAIM